ncbi:MAG TPA: hypothetical protein VGM77_11115 [Gemmatimonadales bacterium]|jgi:quercetin dioxygenase-like cupin family protein
MVTYPDIYQSGDLMIVVNSLSEMGDALVPHRHVASHFSRCVTGKASIIIDGVANECGPGEGILVERSVVHNIVALADDTVVNCEWDVNDFAVEQNKGGCIHDCPGTTEPGPPPLGLEPYVD